MQAGSMVLLTVSPDLEMSWDPTLSRHFLVPNDEVTVTETTNNVSMVNESASAYSNARDTNLANIEIAVQALIFVLAVLGNGFVLLALRYRKRKTSHMHIFITHLSIADLLVALLNILPQMSWDITFRFQGSDVSCRVVKFFQVMVIYLSTYILVMTAIDRYRAICHPLSSYSWSNKKSYLLISIAWIIAIVFSIPQLIIFKMQEVHPGSGVMDCWADFHPEWTLRLYITVFCVTVFFLPTSLLCLLYGRICYVLWHNVYHRGADVPAQCHRGNQAHCLVTWPESGGVRYKFTGNGQKPAIPEYSRTRLGGGVVQGRSHSVSGISRAKIKTIKLTIVVIIAYVVCWTPFITAQMWWAYDESAPFNSSTFVICLLLSSLNSCCNPWIYVAFSESLVQQIFPCCRHKARRKPPDQHCPRERMRFTPTPKPPENGVELKENKRHLPEDIPLQVQIRNNELRRKSAALSRTTSTKLSTLYRTDSPGARDNNVIMKYSREHGIIAAANIANWPCATVYGQAPGHDHHPYAGSSKVARADTKGCECKKCVEAMHDKGQRPGFLTSWREKAEGGNTSASNTKKKTSREWNSKGKRLNLHSDSSHPFLSYKSFAEEEEVVAANDA